MYVKISEGSTCIYEIVGRPAHNKVNVVPITQQENPPCIVIEFWSDGCLVAVTRRGTRKLRNSMIPFGVGEGVIDYVF